MPSYVVTDYTRQQARRLGLEVRSSTRAGKKIDVYRDGKYIGSAGQLGFDDYPNYIKKKGQAYAEERRRLYRARHTEGPKDTPSWLAWNLLW